MDICGFSQSRGSPMLACIGIPQGAYQNMIDKVSESVGLEEGQRIYVCDKFPSDVDAAALGTVFHFKYIYIYLFGCSGS